MSIFKKGARKRDGSGKGVRANYNRGGCQTSEVKAMTLKPNKDLAYNGPDLKDLSIIELLQMIDDLDGKIKAPLNALQSNVTKWSGILRAVEENKVPDLNLAKKIIKEYTTDYEKYDALHKQINVIKKLILAKTKIDLNKTPTILEILQLSKLVK